MSTEDKANVELTEFSDAASSSKHRVSISKEDIALPLQVRSIEFSSIPEMGTAVEYRLYKRRFLGIVGMILLNIVAAMTYPWFGPISDNMAHDFGITLDQVNWLGNLAALVYLPTALLIPLFCARYGFRRCCDVGAAMLLISAWVRYAGTSRSLSGGRAYAFLVLGQILSSVAQPIFQVLGPKYSETWFDLKGRTTATMIIAVSNPVGGGLGQLISPLVGSSRDSILVLGILSSVVAPTVFLIGSAPPTPPTYAGSLKSPTLTSLINALLGRETSPEAQMSRRERFDFLVIAYVFSILVAATTTFGILTSEILSPAGYSDDIAGLMGATLLFAGIIAAIVTAPLFDRVFTHHLAITAKIIVPVVSAGWLSLIWAVKPHNMAGLFVIVTILGVGGVTVLPVGLELGCELTRNADGSSAILWFGANLFSFIFTLAEGALRAGADADPPLNMRRGLIFNGTFVMTSGAVVLLLKGRQARKALDEQKNESAGRGNVGQL